MKTIQTLSIIAFLLAAIACHTTHKSGLVKSPPVQEPAKEIPVTPYVFAKPVTGIYEPGNEELETIRTQYKEVNAETLSEGYFIYTRGACVKCHDASGIYKYSVTEWTGIIDDMAYRASLNGMQKDAVSKYILAIKAVQLKSGK